MISRLVFGQYVVVRDELGNPVELGRGNMGITYLARDPALHREVALKVIRSEAVSLGAARERFLREARAAAQLVHPNVATVFQLGEETGDYFYAMEFVRGENLEAIIKRDGALACGPALRIAREVASALSAAHAVGLVHRDIKPANLMLTRASSGEMTTKVIDFGLAKAVGAGPGVDAALLTNGFVGTLHFASPEQIEGLETDIRADIYSLGATLWHLLTGKTVFEGSLSQVIYGHVHELPPFDRLAAPPEIIDLLKWMLAKEARERPQTPVTLLNQLQQLEGIVPPDCKCALREQKDKDVVEFTLQDLLRSRRTLALGEVVPILEKLAGAVESEWASEGGGFDFRLGAIRIHIAGNDPRSSAEMMRQAVRDWPPFSVAVPHLPGTTALRGGLIGDQTLEEPALPSVARTCIPTLARLAYELLGGNLERLKRDHLEPAPLPALSQDGNELLKRGLEDKSGGAFASAREFCAMLLDSSPDDARKASFSNSAGAAASKPPCSADPRKASLSNRLCEARQLAAKDAARSWHPFASMQRRLNDLRRHPVTLACLSILIILILATATFIIHALVAHRSSEPNPPPAPPLVTPSSKDFARASAGAPFVNGLGMQFVAVPIPGSSGKTILFTRTETTVAEYAAFARASGHDVEKPEFAQGDDHPAVNISWEDATAFCAWLTEKEKSERRIPAAARYRLPTDHEWSCAAGIGDAEDSTKKPIDLSGGVPAVYPWGTTWPPPPKSGNYADTSAQRAGAAKVTLEGYDDGFPYTSPVRAFPPNSLGLYGLGGNASEWCEERTLRGACWRDSDEFYLRSSFRGAFDPQQRFAGYGFRVVLEVPAG